MAQQNTKSKGASVTWYGPNSGREDPVDTLPSEQQPPGVDEPPRPEEEVASTLEEALTTL